MVEQQTVTNLFDDDTIVTFRGNIGKQNGGAIYCGPYSRISFRMETQQ